MSTRHPPPSKQPRGALGYFLSHPQYSECSARFITHGIRDNTRDWGHRGRASLARSLVMYIWSNVSNVRARAVVVVVWYIGMHSISARSYFSNSPGLLYLNPRAAGPIPPARIWENVQLANWARQYRRGAGLSEILFGLDARLLCLSGAQCWIGVLVFGKVLVLPRGLGFFVWFCRETTQYVRRSISKRYCRMKKGQYLIRLKIVKKMLNCSY